MSDSGLVTQFIGASIALIVATAGLMKIQTRIKERQLDSLSVAPSPALSAAPVGNGYAQATVQSVRVASFLATELEALKARIGNLEERDKFVTTENAALKSVNNELRVQVAVLERDKIILTDKVKHLEAENIQHETRIVELEKELAALKRNGDDPPPPPSGPKPPSLAFVDAPQAQKPEDDDDDSADAPPQDKAA